MRRGQRQRKFKKESTIYGIPVKNSNNLDMSQQMNMIDGSELISPQIKRQETDTCDVLILSSESRPV